MVPRNEGQRMTTAPEALHYYVSIRAAQDWNLDAVTEEVEREYLNTLLKRLGNNQCAVAANLGMHRNTLNRRLKKLKLEIQGQVKQRKPEELLVSAGKVRG